METNLLDRMLDAYMTGKTPVTLVLQNKNRVTGRIVAFDSYVIILEGRGSEIVYRHTLSSLTQLVQEDDKRRSASAVPAAPKKAPAVSAPTSFPKPSPKSGQAHPQTVSAPANEYSNSSMREGLLKWMQEQRSAK